MSNLCLGRSSNLRGCLERFKSCLRILIVSPSFRTCRFPACTGAVATRFHGIMLTCFFSLMTLNRSKSVRFLRLSCCSRFFAHDDSIHFLSISFFSHAFLTAPVPAALGRLGMTQGVRDNVLVAMACRGTIASSFVEGPSIRTCSRFISQSVLPQVLPYHTLPGSIISTTVASLPSKGPERRVTTRPTSTSFQPAGLISTLDILPAI